MREAMFPACLQCTDDLKSNKYVDVWAYAVRSCVAECVSVVCCSANALVSGSFSLGSLCIHFTVIQYFFRFFCFISFVFLQQLFRVFFPLISLR